MRCAKSCLPWPCALPQESDLKSSTRCRILRKQTSCDKSLVKSCLLGDVAHTAQAAPQTVRAALLYFSQSTATHRRKTSSCLQLTEKEWPMMGNTHKIIALPLPEPLPGPQRRFLRTALPTPIPDRFLRIAPGRRARWPNAQPCSFSLASRQRILNDSRLLAAALHPLQCESVAAVIDRPFPHLLLSRTRVHSCGRSRELLHQKIPEATHCGLLCPGRAWS